jgi:urease accessory protein
MRSSLTRVLSVALTLAPTAALAHTGAGYVHGFADGFAHPLGGVDHILAMVTVGVLAWQLGGRAIWLLPATFLTCMTIGGVLGAAGEPLPWAEVGIAASVVVFGTTVALGTRTPLAVAMGMAGVFAVFHGHVHGTEMPMAASGAAYGGGFILATALLHAAGIGVGFLIGRISGARFGYRLSGGLVALAGLGMLAHVL